MATCTYGCLRNVINLGNSIIGVSILAMPYCFGKCGIILSMLLIFASGVLTRMACHLLLKAAIMARRRNFEFLAFHTFGSTGKLSVEVGIIGFLIGVCIAFFVVVGDIGPPLASQFLLIENTPNLRAEVLIFLGVFVALPLGMLRKVDSLTSFSALSIAFYICLVLKIVGEAVPKLAVGEWQYQVNWWQPAGILSCLPIFSMALSCQTQLFEFFDTLNDPSLKRMNSVVSGAVNLCSVVYMLVGLFGYVAFCDQPITGNILVRMTPSFMTDMIKLGFIVTVVISFPLCLFPCRTSLHSLLFKQGSHDMPANYIPDHRFRALTLSLVTVTIGISIMLPNIEFVLGFIGSTIGTIICLILPAFIFIHATIKNTNERRMAQFVLIVGTFILVACTYSTLQDANKQQEHPLSQKTTVSTKQEMNVLVNNNIPPVAVAKSLPQLSPDGIKIQKPEADLPSTNHPEKKKLDQNVVVEPSISKEPQKSNLQKPIVPQESLDEKAKHLDETKVNNGDLDPEALKKEDKEIKLQKDMHKNPDLSDTENTKKESSLHKQEELLHNLEVQHEVQKKMLEEHKKLLEELKMQQKNSDDNKNVKTVKDAHEQSFNVKPAANDKSVLFVQPSSYVSPQPINEQNIIQNPPIPVPVVKEKEIPNSVGVQAMKLKQVGMIEDIGASNLNEKIKEVIPPEQSNKIENQNPVIKRTDELKINNPLPHLNFKEDTHDSIKQRVPIEKNEEISYVPNPELPSKLINEHSSVTNVTQKKIFPIVTKVTSIHTLNDIDQKLIEQPRDESRPERDFRKVKRDINKLQYLSTDKLESNTKSKDSVLQTGNLLQNINVGISVHEKEQSNLQSAKPDILIDSHDGLKNEMRKLLEVRTREVNVSKPAKKPLILSNSDRKIN